MEKESEAKGSRKPKEPDTKAARLAQALKANIARRKARARAREAAEKPFEEKD